ncbi:orotidine-5'-phosphate decarboxylase [Cetobacterium somerae]|uniref:orotidine-5'-phosphate decarboxylase n=1 Tax=Cetobacterium somerae TaxID=188913 RepID=UPI00389149E7
MNIKDRLIIALDYSNMEDAKNIVEILGETVSFYKVGLELFLNSKGEMVEYLTQKGKKVFLDLKFHDIPNTTTMASLFAAKQDVFMFNVHASGGRAMMELVAKRVKEVNPEILSIAVTILTSFSEEGLKETFKSELTLKELALNLAKLTKEAGMDGIVCSPWEAKAIKELCGENFKTVCPGVRPKWSVANDQERIMTPKDAILNGCDYLVVGRPITKNENPVEAAKKVLAEIEEGVKEGSLCC